MSHESQQKFSRHERYQENLLTCKDVLNIGPDKPLGYNAPERVESVLGKTIEQFQQEQELKGLKIILLPIGYKGAGTYTKGAIYVYDPVSLQELLDKHVDVLLEFSWPREVDAFVWQVIYVIAPQKTKLFDLVADAFVDKDNDYRTDFV